jgi:transposase
MSKTYRPWDPDQTWLLPPSPRDWLPEGDLVYFVMDVVRDLDLSAITSYYEREERGYPPYHPRMMATLVVYAYTQGIYSSRRIQKRCERDAAFRGIVGEDVPDFRTISDFRKIHLKALSGLFAQVLRLCREAGLVKLGHVALDGTKIKANASRHKAMSYGRMGEEEERLHREIAEMMRQAEAADAEEDRQYGREHRGDELPQELARRESRLKRIREARQALEERAKVKAQAEQKRREDEARAQGQEPPKSPPPEGVQPDPKAQYNFTDPESRIMKASNKGWDQCGNAQAVVDAQAQVIVACDVTAEANDKRQLAPMLAQAQANVGPEGKVKRALADTGYFSEANVKWTEREKIDAYLATGKIKHHERVKAAPRGRLPGDLTVKEKMARKLRTKKGRETYAKRKGIVEPVFGQIKRARGFTQFLLRGLEKMRGEWSLVCLAHNLWKLFGARRAAA